MTKRHPTGEIIQKQHKPGDGFTGMSAFENLQAARLAVESPEFQKRIDERLEGESSFWDKRHPKKKKAKEVDPRRHSKR